MKDKRYFCDWYKEWEKPATNNKQFVIKMCRICILTLLCFTTLLGVIKYKINMYIYGSELNSYPKNTYDYLEEIASNVIHEGEYIDIKSMPEEVKYSVEKNENDIIFKYYLPIDNHRLIDKASETIKLSKDLQIESKENNYSSEEEYRKFIKICILWDSILFGLVGWVTILFIAWMVIFPIAAKVSMYNKKKNSL